VRYLIVVYDAHQMESALRQRIEQVARAPLAIAIERVQMQINRRIGW